MTYKFLPNIATADVAFEAKGATLEELFQSCIEATTQVMVEDLSSIVHKEEKTVFIEEDMLDMVLFKLLEEIVFFKDAEQLLLLPGSITINHPEGPVCLTARLYGEMIDASRHELNADVKAITMHQFSVTKESDGWKAMVVLDV